jgi:Hemerythrin HHE cation binding domain
VTAGDEPRKPSAEQPPEPNPLFEELLWVHAMIRRDLETVQRLAADVDDGLTAPEVAGRLEELKANGPLWRLKVNCLHYCRFVHSHHRLEDAALFPALRRIDPGLDSVVDKLEADHRAVAEGLGEVERGAEALTEDDGGAARPVLSAALERLASTLLDHLTLEERELERPMSRMRGLRG